MFNTIFPKIHKEGYKFLAISILATFIVLFFSKFIGSLFILITVWVYYFFRDPERYSINDDSYLVSPADGLISFSLMNDHIILVISSPSSSTTGFLTFILAIKYRLINFSFYTY